jgi:hypothetical protein
MLKLNLDFFGSSANPVKSGQFGPSSMLDREDKFFQGNRLVVQEELAGVG